MVVAVECGGEIAVIVLLGEMAVVEGGYGCSSRSGGVMAVTE